MTSIVNEGRPRFLTDEGFNQDVTRGLRQRFPEIDLFTTQELGLSHKPDAEILRAAHTLGRIVLSHDVRTMPGYFFALQAQLPEGEQLPGLLLVAQRAPVGMAIEWIAEIYVASRQHEWRDRVEYLPL